MAQSSTSWRAVTMLILQGGLHALHDPHALGRHRPHQHDHVDARRSDRTRGAGVDRHADGHAVPHRPGGGAGRGRIAWVSSQSGVHNIWIAEPPAHKARAVTTYTGDDGQWITELAWTSDAKTLVYVRGDGRESAGRVAQSRAAAGRHRAGRVRGRPSTAAPLVVSDRAAGRSPSPQGQRVAWVSTRADLERGPGAPTDEAAQLVNARGTRVRARVVAGRLDARVHQQPRHAQLHRRVHARVARAALSRSVARSRRQRRRGPPTARASPGSARAPRRGRACSRRGEPSTSRGPFASPT